jgi:hypothetical protein
MELLRDELLSRGEEFIGRRIEYGSLGPSFLGGVDIRSFRILGKGPAPLFSASRLRLSWSLWDLLRPGGRRLRGLRIERPELYIDPREDGDLPDLLIRLKEASSFDVPQDAFSFRIRDGIFRVEGIGSLSGLDMDAEIRGGRIEAQGEWDAELHWGDRSFAGLSSAFPVLPAALTRFLGGGVNLSAAGRFRLSGETDLSRGKAFLSLPFAAEDRFRIGGLELNLELKDRILSLSSGEPGRAAPFGLVLDYGLDTGGISARLNFRDYSPAGTLKFLGPWKDYNRFLALRAAGEAAFDYSAEGVLDYRADLSGFIPPGLPLSNSGFHVKLAGRGNQADFERLDLNLVRGSGGNQAGGALSFQGRADLGSLNLNGTLDVRNLSLTGEGGIDARLRIRSRGRDTAVSAERFAAGGTELSALELELHREAEGLSFSAAGRAPGGAAVQADGTLDYAPRHLEARFTLDSFSARDFAEIALPLVEKFRLPARLPPLIPKLWEDALRDTRITAEIFASTDFGQVLYNAPRLVISYAGYQEFIALFSLSGTGRHFTLDGGQILWDGGSVQITGQSDFSDTENISFSLNIAYGDLNYYLRGGLENRRSLSIQGSHNFEALVVSEGEGNYSGRVRGENVPFQLGERTARASFNFGMDYHPAESWFLELTGLELADFAPSGSGLEGAGLLRLSGRADQDRILLRDIYFDDALGALQGSGAFFPAGGGEYRGNISLTGENFEESYTADLSWVPEEGPGENPEKMPGNLAFMENLIWPRGLFSALLNSFSVEDASPAPGTSSPEGRPSGLKMRISGTGMRLMRFSRAFPNIRTNGILDLQWRSLRDFDARLSLYSLGAGRGGREISAGGQAVIDGRGFRFENLRLAVGELEILAPRFGLSMDESRMEGEGRVQGRFSGREIAADFSLDSRFAPMDNWLDYAAALQDLRGTIELSGMVIGGQAREEVFQFAFSSRGEGVVFSGGPEDMIFFDVKRDGAFIAAFADPFPLRGAFIGTLSLGGIDVRGENIFVNLPALWQFIPIRNEFDISSGYALGSLQIRGPLENPEFYGTARGEDLRMRVPRFLAEDVVPIGMNLVFDGSEIYFTGVPASCGKGMGTVSGRFWMEKWILDSFSLDITAARDQPLPFSFDLGGILARGTVSGALNLAMSGKVMNVSGDLTAQETEISLNAAEIAASQEEDAWGALDVPVIADILITAGKKLEFLWPTREFPMLQAYADLGTKAKVQVNSLDRSFAFTGDVKLRGGEVFYFERSFYIRNGMLSFRENQNKFDPLISVRAETRDRASSGPVTISMVVDKAPLLSFIPRFESSPALSQMEIISLLGQSFVGAAGEDGRIAAPFLNSSADLLAQSQVMRRIQGALRDLLHLDMFSVRTQFIQRAAFGFMGIQERPVDRIGWVGNYFDNTSVFIGKYIGSEMFAQAMLSLRYDENKRSFGGYTFEPDFGIELRSPLGNIRWNLVPTHPENWYLDDCSFTISWNFSF